MLDQLEGFGFARDRLALTARRMRRAQLALDRGAERFLSEAAQLDDAGFITLDLAAFRDAPEETVLRALSRALMAVGGSPEPPRLNKLETLVEALRSDFGRSRTLAGCRIVPEQGRIRLFREPGRDGLPEMSLPPGELGVWDRRFRVSISGGREPLTVRALGRQGFAELRRQLDIGPAVGSDMASGLASFWRGRELIAVPHLGYLALRRDERDSVPNRCSAEFVNGALLGPEFSRRFGVEKADSTSS
jgi:tRNA(Ile)-lysidine synthase